jgi:predicted NBD/HSP70 family sugar kinase
VKDSVGVRQVNLSRILRLVHLDGPLSRASLTESTGLNRSTIADLIAELITLGLLLERAPDPSRRVGRPSPIAVADPDVIAIAVNPEVDALTMAAVGLDRSIPIRVRIEFDELVSPERTAQLIADQIGTWRANELVGRRIVGVGVAVPGLVRASDGLVRDAPHLRWQDVALRDIVEESTGLPTVVGNDATMGVVAEHLFGAARGIDDVVYLNGGASGIGGGLVVQGVPVTGAQGYAGEFGQNRPGIAAGADRRAGDGSVLEDEVSRARLLASVGLQGADEPTLAAALATGTSPEVHDEVLRQRRILATALANAVNVLNPSVVVLGGFLATLVQDDLEGMLQAVRHQAMPATCDDLAIRVALLAEDRLLAGAAEAVFADLLRDPLGAASLSEAEPLSRAG